MYAIIYNRMYAIIYNRMYAIIYFHFRFHPIKENIRIYAIINFHLRFILIFNRFFFVLRNQNLYYEDWELKSS